MSTQHQVLLRLPEDLAARFAHVVPLRQRSRYLIDLLRRDLERESSELAQAAKRLTALEARHPALAAEQTAWLNQRLAADQDDGFDAQIFERQFKEARTREQQKSQKLPFDKSARAIKTAKAA